MGTLVLQGKQALYVDDEFKALDYVWLRLSRRRECLKLLSSEVKTAESYYCTLPELDLQAVDNFMSLPAHGVPMIVVAMPDAKQAGMFQLLATRYPKAGTVTIAPSAARMESLTDQLAEADGGYQL